jgi:recombination protein RecT
MSTEIVRADPRIGAIKLQLEKGKALIAQVAPKHLTADRMVRLAMLAVSKQPKLAECSGMSILKSMMVASELGLEPGGALGHGYLVPYRVNQAKRGEPARWVNECQFIAGYRGLAKLARNSGEIEIVEAHPVYPGDKFVVRRGTVSELVHEPDYLSGNDRGDKAVCYYALARYKSGAVQFEVMTRAQIETIMRSTQSKGDYGPWLDHFDEQARKTCIRRLAKSLPLESEKHKDLLRAIEVSDARDEGDVDIEIPVDVVAVEETASPNDATKQALKAKTAKPATGGPGPGPGPTTAQTAEAKRLRDKLDEHNPALAARLWAEHSAPYTETQYTTLIEKLTAEVQSAEGGPA